MNFNTLRATFREGRCMARGSTNPYTVKELHDLLRPFIGASTTRLSVSMADFNKMKASRAKMCAKIKSLIEESYRTNNNIRNNEAKRKREENEWFRRKRNEGRARTATVPMSPNTKKLFNNLIKANTPAEAKKLYHKGALKLHPNKGGNTAIFQIYKQMYNTMKK